MLKRLPSRTQRSKGIRAKHVLQICLLLGVCFWLIYQVKHSHDKKKEFDENDVKSGIRRVTDVGIPKLGRKDLHPLEDIIRNEKQEEEEEVEPLVEEEEQHGEEREEEENKNDPQEQEDEEENNKEEAEENKDEEAEDGGRGGGDDEIDENDQERKEGEGNRDEDFVEEKEQEDGDDESKTNDNEDVEDQLENENSSEDQDNDGSDQSDHEAREEHYIRDDASSEVAHDTQVISTGTEKTSSEISNENTEISKQDQEDKSNNGEDINKIESKGETAENRTLDVVSLAKKVDNNNSSKSGDSQVLVTTQSNDQPEAGNNPVQVSTEASNSSAVVSLEASNDSTVKSNDSTETRNETSEFSELEQKKIEIWYGTSDSSQQNKMESVSDSGHVQNGTVDETTTGEIKTEQTPSVEQTSTSTIGPGDNKVEFNSLISTKVENADGVSKELSDSSKNPETDASGKILRPDETGQVEDGAKSSTTKENTDATQNEKSGNKSESNGAEEGSNSTGGTEEGVQHDPIDSSDIQIAQDVKDALTDLGTLPDMESQRVESEELAAE